jgi:hypothetical protein
MIKMYALSHAMQQLLFNFNIGTVQDPLNNFASNKCYFHVLHCVLDVCDHSAGQCQWTYLLGRQTGFEVRDKNSTSHP